MSLLGSLRRLMRRDELPAGFGGRLGADEHVLGSAALTGGGHVVVTSLGLWIPDGVHGAGPDGPPDAHRRVGWHLVSKATWQGGAIALVEATETEVLGRATVIEDLPVRRLRLADPGRVPEVVQARVTASIRSRHHRELPPSGGAWFVQRKVPGRDGIVLQVRPDPGTDHAVVRRFTEDVARTLGLA